MIESLESKGLSLFRVLLVASFWIFLIGAVLFYAYAGFKLATNSAENIDPPKLESVYVPPKVGPVEMRKAQERLRDAKRSFESKFDDAVILTLDAVGEWSTSSVYIGEGNKITQKKRNRISSFSWSTIFSLYSILWI